MARKRLNKRQRNKLKQARQHNRDTLTSNLSEALGFVETTTVRTNSVQLARLKSYSHTGMSQGIPKVGHMKSNSLRGIKPRFKG